MLFVVGQLKELGRFLVWPFCMEFLYPEIPGFFVKLLLFSSSSSVFFLA